jgi:hypothetical protein
MAHGVDRVFAVNLATRLWMLLFGPIVLGVIIHKLSIAEQGFYYTFLSLIGLSVFLDMGFTRAVQVFTSHEFASLNLLRGKPMEGSAVHRQRMADFGKAILLVHLILAVVAGVIIALVGEFMFRREANAAVAWHGPWWSLSFAAAASFVTVPMSTMLEAAGHVPQMAWAKFARQVTTNLILVGALWSGQGLSASAISAWVGFALMMVLMVFPYAPFWRQLLDGRAREGFKLLRELAVYQVRIAVSWAAGYFIFSIMTPIAFYALGAEDAARMGLTWQVMGLVSSIAFSVIQTKTPTLGTLVGQGRSDEALSINQRATRGALFIAAAGYLAILFGLGVIREFPNLGWPALLTKGASRMLPLVPIALLALAELGKLQMLGVFSFVRTLKVEPFTTMLVTLAVAVPLACWALAANFGVEWLCFGYVLGQLVANPWANRLARPYLGNPA